MTIEYPVKVEIHTGDEETQFIISPNELYKVVSAGIKTQFEIDPHAPEEQKTLARMVRTAVKGALIAFGPKLLDMLFKTKDHPKPSKGDDLIEWYADIFAKILIAGATQQTLILKSLEGRYGQKQPIIIHEVCSIPISTSNGGSEGGREPSLVESTS